MSEQKVTSNHYLIKGLIIALIIIVLDQVTKIMIFDFLSTRGGYMKILPFFNLVMVENRGISFGLFSDKQYSHLFFLVTSSLITVFLLVWLKKAENKVICWGLALMIGGAVGNIIDRVRMGAVADFLDFHVAGFHWPAFNVADASICIGAFFLIIDAIFFSNGKKSTMNDV
ncbi:MAG: signal peptidase II [Rickettsiales bacterium]|nr:signal peptidase II [Rickettsiales bacterium]